MSDLRHTLVPVSGLSTIAASFVADFDSITAVLARKLPEHIDGRWATLEMKRVNGMWRQMEWPGWYFEHLVTREVLPSAGGKAGPTYGSTTFDLMLGSPWDLKTHSLGTRDIILNDIVAVDACIAEYGSINYLLLAGIATYDDDLKTYKRWHDILKGDPTSYVSAGIRTGRRSRVRKTSFQPTRLLGIHLDAATLRHGLSTGAISRFQDGMRNAGGNERRGKYKILLAKIDPEFLTMSIDLTAPGSTQ